MADLGFVFFGSLIGQSDTILVQHVNTCRDDVTSVFGKPGSSKLMFEHVEVTTLVCWDFVAYLGKLVRV